MFVYVGAYTEPPLGEASGVSVYRFDPELGTLTLVQSIAGSANPSFLALDAQQSNLYAVNEVDEGYATAFSREPETGELTELNRQITHGAAPCFISIDASGRYALVANYAGGTVAVLPIRNDGSLEAATSVIQHVGSSVNPTRQEAPHPHMVASSPDGRYVLVTDLGIDQIQLYQLEATSGRLELHREVQVEPGSGPRHFAFDPSGRYLYVINELASTLSAYAYDGEQGDLRALQTVSTLPDHVDVENSCAHVAVAPDGRFVYGSNRGHDSIAIWQIDEATGKVTLVGHESTRGHSPRNFSLDPTGSWLLAANQNSGTIVSFRRDSDSGLLTATGQVTETPSPVAIVFA